MRKNNILTENIFYCSRIASLGLLFLFFFSVYLHWHINTYHVLLFLDIICIILFVIEIRKVVIKRTYLGLYAVIGALILSCLLSSDFIYSIKYTFLFISITFLTLLVLFDINEEKRFISGIYYGSILECFFILLHSLNSSVIDNLNSFLFMKEQVLRINSLSKNGGFSGIAGETVYSCLFAIIVCIISIIKFIENKKVKHLFTLILGLICIYLSNKRSSILIFVGVIFLTFIVYYPDEKRKLLSKRNLAIFLLLVMFFILLFYSNLGSNILFKNRLFTENGDVSNGRNYLNQQMMKIFKNNPLFGIGIYATSSYYGEYLGHNIYLQLLSEVGLVGFSAFMLFFISVFHSLSSNSKLFLKKDIFVLAMYFYVIIYGFFGNPLFSTIFLIPFLYSCFKILNVAEDE